MFFECKCAGCGKDFKYDPVSKPAWRGPFEGQACSLRCAVDAKDRVKKAVRTLIEALEGIDDDEQ